MNFITSFATAALMLFPFAAASQTTERELAKCREIGDGVRRLACYDAIALAAPRAPATGAAPSPSASLAPAPAARSAPDPLFGLPQRVERAAEEMVESRISGRFDGWVQGTRLTLENGQVWEVTDNSKASYSLDRPAVRVSRGVLGSFFIEIQGVSRTPRVRRVN